jgi:phospholipid/cholesterol/gamma-HCH transport system substrate-binding protein
MPDARKVRWSQMKVGVVAVCGFLILFVLVFLLTQSQGLFHSTVDLRTYMDDASGITEGAPVRLNGILVGSLDKVTLTNTKDPKRTVEFSMQIRSEYLPQIPEDSVVGIAASNLLGDKYLNITKGLSSRPAKDGAELKSLQSQDIPELMAQMSGLLKSFQDLVTRVGSLLQGVEEGKGNLGLFLKDEELYRRINDIANEGKGLLADIRSSKGTFGKLIYDDALYNEIRAPLKRVDAMLADLQAGQGSAGKLLHDPALYDDARNTITEIKGLLADLNAGKGTAGKLLKDENLHKHLDELVAKLNGTMDKINSGQGTLGQLMVNPQLYEALTGTTREFQSLAKDMRANPKKFLTIRLQLF